MPGTCTLTTSRAVPMALLGENGLTMPLRPMKRGGLISVISKLPIWVFLYED